ncbi:MAG TPA: hypothetical protein VN642_11045 [Dongiaceae bacterium]|nr:hypothetical protein [Dongiaceae bacterium]
MIELIINNFEKIIGSILVAVFGGYITYRIYRKTRFSQAAAIFRTKVLTELEGLYPIPTNWPPETMMIDRILKEKFPKLQIAVAEFRPFLSRSEKTAFDEAWSSYRVGEDGREINQQDYWQYIPHSGTSVVNGKEETHDNTETYQDNFKRNVDNLLKFAKHT